MISLVLVLHTQVKPALNLFSVDSAIGFAPERRGGGGSYIKMTGALVIPFRGENF